MTYTTNYNLNIVEGTDIVNPLTQLNPNFTALDSIIKAIADASVTPATCIKSGTVHTVTRTNTDAEMFVFTATGDWNTGDTMTVDGTPVTPVLPDGTALLSGSYLINAEVLCSIKGTKVTVYSNKYNIGADIVDDLTSTATDKALSANQGKVLNDTKISNAASLDNGSFVATSIKDYLTQVCDAVKALSPGRYVFRHSYAGQWTALFIASVISQGSDAHLIAVPLGVSKIYIAFVAGLTTYAGESPAFTTLS